MQKALWNECACLKNSEEATMEGRIMGDEVRKVNREEEGGDRCVGPCRPCKEFSFTPSEWRSDKRVLSRGVTWSNSYFNRLTVATV